MTVIETRYAGTGGVLIGSGARWLLLGADPTPEDAEALWSLLARPGPVVDAALDLLEKQHPEGLPSLALLDLAPGAVESATRGDGRITLDDEGRLLTLGHPDGRPELRLVGGVVAAGFARVREIAPPTPPRPATSSALVVPPPAGRPLIDQVPAHILSATAPERQHDTSSLARALDSAPRSAVTADPVGAVPTAYSHDPEAPPAFEPARPPHRAEQPHDNPPAQPSADVDPDHDGQTTFRPAAARPVEDAEQIEDGGTARSLAGHLRHPTSETVLAVRCPTGHLTAAYSPECRVCHRPVPTQDPQRLPRPRLGALTLPTGEVVPLDRGVVLGRKPHAVPGGEPYPHLVHLPSESTYLSRLHLHVELDGWLVLARDLGSQSGTRLHVPGRDPEQLRPHEAYVLEHGHTLDLADVYPVTFEVVE